MAPLACIAAALLQASHGASAEPGSAAAWAPDVAPVAGASLPVDGGDPGVRVGFKAALVDLSSGLPGLQFVVPAFATISRGPVTGLEVGAGFELQRPIGSGPLGWYADLSLGYRHDHQIVETAFVGYQVQAANFFVARVEAGLAWRVSGSIRLVLEPVSFGFYRGSATRIEYAPVLGVGVRL